MNIFETDPRRAEAAGILVAVADGAMTAEAAIAGWPFTDVESSSDRAIGWALHFLHHFHADEDIRHRDPDYDHGQRQELQKLAKEIRL